MKAVTEPQPGATLVALGVKTMLTRSSATSYRGPLALHAGARGPRRADNRVGDYSVRGYGSYRGGGWVLEGPGLPQYRSPRFEGYKLPLGAIVATCTLADVVPIVRPASGTGVIPPDSALIDPGKEFGLRWTEPISSSSHGWKLHHCEDQRPYGDFTAGRWAWLLEDAKPTTERCPICWGDRIIRGKDAEQPLGGLWINCPTCDGKGTCDPIPARGGQGLWEWTSRG